MLGVTPELDGFDVEAAVDMKALQTYLATRPFDRTFLYKILKWRRGLGNSLSETCQDSVHAIGQISYRQRACHVSTHPFLHAMKERNERQEAHYVTLVRGGSGLQSPNPLAFPSTCLPCLQSNSDRGVLAI